MTKTTWLGRPAAYALAALTSILTLPELAAQSESQMEVRTQGPSMSSDLLSDDSGVEVTVGEEGEGAVLKLAVDRGATNFSLILSSPISKDTERADFFGFDGLNSEAAVKIGLTQVFWPKVEPTSTTYSTDEQDDITAFHECVLVLEALKALDSTVRWQGNWPPALAAAAKDVSSVDLPSLAMIRDYVSNPDRYSDLKPEALKEALEREPGKTEYPIWQWLTKQGQGFGSNAGVCNDDTLYEAYVHLRLDGGLEKRRLAAGKKPMFLSFDATAGRKTFNFLDPSNLEKDSNREIPGSIGLSFGWVFLSKTLATMDKSVAISLRRETNYKAADSVQVCQPQDSPVDDRTVESCTTAALGAPSEADSTFYGLEYRYLGRRVGTGFRAYYRGKEREKDDFGFEVPLYFLSTSEGKLSGGVRFGWSDLEDDLSVTVFVGRAFSSLWPGN